MSIKNEDFQGSIYSFNKREFDEKKWKSIWLTSGQYDVFEKYYKKIWFFDPEQNVAGLTEIVVLAMPDDYIPTKKNANSYSI